MEAVSFSGTLLGIQTQHGIVLLAEKKTSSKLLESGRQPEKLYAITQSIVCGVAGVTADANTLLKEARKHALAAEFAYGTPISVEQLAQTLSDVKQSYTQFGGMRPFGVSLLYAGWDGVDGLQLLQSDPSGNYSRWRAYCVGANQQPITTALKAQYAAEMPLVDAVRMALRIYAKSAEASCVVGERRKFHYFVCNFLFLMHGCVFLQWKWRRLKLCAKMRKSRVSSLKCIMLAKSTCSSNRLILKPNKYFLR